MYFNSHDFLIYSLYEKLDSSSHSKSKRFDEVQRRIPEKVLQYWKWTC